MQTHGDVVIVAYRPKPGQEAALAGLVAEHVPLLRSWGLATERPHLVMRAADGTLIEAFEWRAGAVAAAHKDARVQGMWERFGAACDYVPLRDLAEAADMFATFAPVESDSMVQMASPITGA